jgi:hypothetical protein
MSQEEFDALYNKSVDWVKTSDADDAIRERALELMSQVDGFIRNNTVTVDVGISMVKQIVAAVFQGPPKVKAG